MRFGFRKIKSEQLYINWIQVKIIDVFYILYRYGRKNTLLFSVAPHLVGWLLVGTANHIAQLYVARIIFGIALGFAFTLVPMYCGEIAEVPVTLSVYGFFYNTKLLFVIFVQKNKIIITRFIFSDFH